jgi:cell shape-determining protein MreC
MPWIRNRDIVRKKQEIEFFKAWKNIASNNTLFQNEVSVGLEKMENELEQLEIENIKWNKLLGFEK